MSQSLPSRPLPPAAIVIPNYQGSAYLADCLQAALAQDYAGSVEIIVVDNGSSDGSRELAQAITGVRVIANDSNRGFATACNQGARATGAEYVAFLNNDAVPERDWLRRLIEPLVAAGDGALVCTGGLLLEPDGQIDFAGGGATFSGFATSFGRGVSLDRWGRLKQEPILFACGGAMAIRREVFLDVGGFDEAYFAYLEDVDLGWRLWLLGYQVLFVPEARAMHRKHATSSRMYGHQLRRLIERNALATIIKNYDEATLSRVLGAALLLQLRRVRDLGGPAMLEERAVRLRAAGDDDPAETSVPRDAFAPVLATNDLLDRWPDLWRKRQTIQARRHRSDAEIAPLLGAAWLAAAPGAHYRYLQEQLVTAFDLAANLPGARRRVLVLSGDPIGPEMAGTAIRAYEIARTLARYVDVRIAAPACTLDSPDVPVSVAADEESIAAIARDMDVVIAQGHALRRYPWLLTSNVALVCDLYDPFYLGGMSQADESPADAERIASDVAAVNEQLDYGDFFICAGERQRDYWLGGLAARGRLTTAQYRRDPTLRRLIDVAPFGIPSVPPVRERPVLKGVHPAIGGDDRVVLWGGGVWEWLDPLTVIRAVARLAPERPDLRLFFLGSGHPVASISPGTMLEQARQLAADLGLLDRVVIFNDGWTTYDDRGAYLLEADIGVSAHGDHLETRFAFRTRLLDYIWAGLPMIVTGGDELSELVAREHLGYVVPPGDDEAFARALADLLDRPRESFAPQFAAVQTRFRWERTLQPLIRFCCDPQLAPDTPARRARLAGGIEQQRESAEFPSLARRIRELEHAIAAKNAHIERLEHLLRRIESGRVMRLLRRLGR